MRFFGTLVSRSTTIIGGTILILMVLQIVVDVFMRNIMGAGFPATAEVVSKYYMVIVSFLPIAFTECRRRHVEASIFTDMAPTKAKPVFMLIGFVLSLGVYTLLTYGTIAEAMRQTSQGAYVEAGTMDFYTWPSYWILPISFGLMTIAMVIRVVSVLRGRSIEDSHLLMEDDDMQQPGGDS